MIPDKICHLPSTIQQVHSVFELKPVVTSRKSDWCGIGIRIGILLDIKCWQTWVHGNDELPLTMIGRVWMRFDVNWYTLNHTRVLHDCRRILTQPRRWFDYLAMHSYDHGRDDQINWLLSRTHLREIFGHILWWLSHRSRSSDIIDDIDSHTTHSLIQSHPTAVPWFVFKCFSLRHMSMQIFSHAAPVPSSWVLKRFGNVLVCA